MHCKYHVTFASFMTNPAMEKSWRYPIPPTFSCILVTICALHSTLTVAWL